MKVYLSTTPNIHNNATKKSEWKKILISKSISYFIRFSHFFASYFWQDQCFISSFREILVSKFSIREFSQFSKSCLQLRTDFTRVTSFYGFVTQNNNSLCFQGTAKGTEGVRSPPHDILSSESPPSYNQLNYNDNLARFFNSQPKTLTAKEAATAGL